MPLPLKVEFDVFGEGATARLEMRREFRSRYLLDNVQVDHSSGDGALWLGAVGTSHASFFAAETPRGGRGSSTLWVEGSTGG